MENIRVQLQLNLHLQYRHLPYGMANGVHDMNKLEEEAEQVSGGTGCQTCRNIEKRYAHTARRT